MVRAGVEWSSPDVESVEGARADHLDGARTVTRNSFDLRKAVKHGAVTPHA